MWRMVAVSIGILAVAIFGFTLIDTGGGGEVGASTFIDASAASTDGFARAIEPYDWEFPADFGAHPDFQTEWWYYTGNLSNDAGERFGFQFTIFRRAINPDDIGTESEWRDNQIYMAHFT
ncbi:MAG: lipocalin-like domain-containing protein, partial [Aggregatilineales bacterium]